MAKIVVVTAATNTIPRFRMDMIDEFVRRGNEVVVAGDESHEQWDSFFAGHGVRYRRYNVERNGTNPVKDLATQRQLEELFRQEKPDKVFTYQIKPNIYGSVAAYKSGVESIYCMMGGLGSVFRTKGLKGNTIERVVTGEYKNAFKHVTKVFFQNEEDVDAFAKRSIVTRDKVVMVRGSGVNLEQFPRRPLPSRLSFLFVGRLVRGKGILDYLDAAAMVKEKHPEISFHVVGPLDTNPTAIQYEEIQPYFDEGIAEYHGEQQNVQPFQEASSVFVLPSYYGEGTPKSALEAMATGRALIMADAVGCREVVREGENGFLVPPKNPQVLAETMMRFVNEPQLVVRMGEASRHLAEDLFDVNKVDEVICQEMGI